MKQVGLALHNYHDTNGSFPAQDCWVDNSYNWSALYAILPFAENQAAYETLRTEAYAYTGSGTPDPHTQTCPSFGKIKIEAYICPSDENAAIKNDDGTAAMYRSSISLCIGDVVVNNNEFGARTGGSVDQSWYTADQVKNRAFFFPHVWKNMAMILDGTSNTIAIGEMVVSLSKSGDKRVRGGVNSASSVKSGIWSSSAPVGVIASTCLNARNGNTLTGTDWPNTWRGARWADGRSSMAAFCTVLPPNSPSCYRNNHNSWGIYSSSSFHSGGMNTLFADGSVHFISDTIDCGTNMSAAQNPGVYYSTESPYGVWGALGTLQGGETKRL